MMTSTKEVIQNNEQQVISIGGQKVQLAVTKELLRYGINNEVNIMPHVFWKDRQGKYLGGSANQAKAFNFNSAAEFIGKTIYDILDDIESARLIDKTDNEIMDNDQVVILEETILTPNGVRTYLSQKQPIYDNNGIVIGLLGFSMDITQIKEQEKLAKEETEKEQEKFYAFVKQLSHIINNHKISVLKDQLGKAISNAQITKPILTKREEEVLYYLSFNKSPKEIASILSILDGKDVTAKTIQSIIDKQLYTKFKVYNIGDLIEQANIHQLIPFLLNK